MVQLLMPMVLNVSVFLAAVVIKTVSACFRKVRSFRKSATNEAAKPLLDEHTAFSKSQYPEAAKHNYLACLQTAKWLFITLSLLNLLVYLPLDKGQSMLHLDCNYSWLRHVIMETWDNGDLQFLDFFYLYLLVGNGLVVLLFTRILESRLRIGHLRANMTERMRRTVWLSSMPKEDLQTGVPFDLSDADVAQVESDLKKALTDWGAEVEVLRVAVRVDDWANVKLALGKAEEHCVMYEKRESELQGRCDEANDREEERRKTAKLPACCSPCKQYKLCCMKRRLRKVKDKHRSEETKKAGLMASLSKYEKGTKYLSGSAFVTLETEEAAKALLESKIPCWRLDRDHAFFTFGRPPFASVTLQCRRAPSPRDIVWEHLHNDYRLWNFLRYCFTSVLLFLIMLIIVTPTTFAAMVPPFIRIANENIDQLKLEVEQSEIDKDTKARIVSVLDGANVWFVQALVEQLPTLILLLINSVILPFLIEAMGRWERCYRKSVFELHQKQQNHVFLFLNTLVFPVIGVTSAMQIIQMMRSSVDSYLHEGSSVEIIDTLNMKLKDSSAALYGLKYLLTSTFISGAFALLDVGQAIGRCFGRCFIVTERDRRELYAPSPFPWGYWYAWNSTIFSLIFFYCCFVPSMLPAGAVFFLIRHKIDKFNFNNNVYVSDTDTEGTLAFNLIRDMRITVAGAWFLAGVAGMFSKFLLDYYSLEVPIMITWEFRILGAFLVFASLMITWWAFWVYRKQCLEVELGGKTATIWRDPQSCFNRFVGNVAGCLGIRMLEEKDVAESAEGVGEGGMGHAWDSRVCLGLMTPGGDQPELDDTA